MGTTVTGRTPESITTHAEWLGADRDVAREAAARVATGELALLGVNGWMGSGKDTIAPLVMAAVGLDVAAGGVVHSYFAKALKSEVDERVLPALTDATCPTVGAAALVGGLDVPLEQARQVTDRMWDHTRPGHGLTAYSRTTEMRWLLQFWGTNVRRAQDSDYWVKLALIPVISHLAEGRHVYVTDARFPNEVDGARRLGFHVVRLDITRETQRARLMGRDGLTEEQYLEATSHPSETALDDFPRFDQRIGNDGGVERIAPVVAEIAAAMPAVRTAVANDRAA